MNEADWQWHYVRQNEASRYPRRIVCLDTESLRSQSNTVELHSFRLGVGSFDLIDPISKLPARTDWIETDKPGELWEWIASQVRNRERLVCFAHNLGYDLRISQAFTLLPSLGFRLRFISLDSRRCYARFSRGTATLVLADSMSFLPRSLEAIAGELGLAKTPLPDEGDAPDKWFERCRTDVAILRQAMLSLLDWLERNDSGNFKPTGPAQSWATFRHRFLKPRTLLVHRDEEALAAEREAAWTGRTEAWRHGEFYVPLTEYDYRLAYAHIAAQEGIPCRLLGSCAYNRPLGKVITPDGQSLLLRCRVTSDREAVPCRVDGRIAWPVGEFQTTLWDREARLAEANGASVFVERAWRYRSAPILQAWGQWIIAQLTDDTLAVPPLVRIMLKHWARCLIGRFAMRYPEWQGLGHSEQQGLLHFDCFSTEDEHVSEYLQLASDWYICERKRDGHDTLPAVMSYVMALQRIKIWEAIQAAGEDEVFYCDTDSILTTDRGAGRLKALAGSEGHRNLVPKARYGHVQIFGPRAIIVGEQPRIAGLPRNASPSSRTSYKTEAWQSLSDALKTGNATTVRVAPRSFRIPSEDHRRRHLANGRTAPYEVSSA